MVQDDKRTKIGPTGPVRPVTEGGGAAPASDTPAPTASTPIAPAPTTSASTTPAPTTPAPTTDPPASAATSYLPPLADPLLGQVLAGRYLIQKKLGEGGMASVYLATHNVIDKQVALKVLHGEFVRKPDLVERFMQEAKAASRIRHENVIDISDFGTTAEGLVFFAMELLQGHDLHEEIARARIAGQLLPWDRSKRIFLQICAALAAAHATGIIHRDLKPENIYLVDFLGDPDFVKLLDFGIAKQTEVTEGDRKLTRTGMLFGTPEYMSPEQARGEPIDHRVDVYAMGCILFQLVTGRVPFEANNFMGVLTMHLTEPPPAIPPEVFDSIGAPRVLAEVILQAMAKDRNQRFATIEELADAVRRASGDKPTSPAVAQASVPAPSTTVSSGPGNTPWTTPPSLTEVDVRPPPRSKLPMILGAIVLVGSIAGAAVYLVPRDDGTRSGEGSASGSPTGDVATAGATQGPSVASASSVTPAAPAVAPTTPTVPITPAVAPAAPSTPTAEATPAAAPPEPAVAPPEPAVAAPPAQVEPLAFEWAQIRLDSTPPGASVKDLTNGTLIGRTPFTFKVRPSHNARQFGLHRKNYVDAVVEIIPDRQKIEYTEKLTRGASGRPAAGRASTDPKLKPPPGGSAPPGPAPAQKTEPATVKADPPEETTAPTPPRTEPVKPPKPADDGCEPPCLKEDPTRAGSAGKHAP